jgi:predicted nucleotidyltransferase
MEQSAARIFLFQALSSIDYSRCILFGSHARGTARDDSDYDILVVMRNPLTHTEKFTIASTMRKKLADNHIDVDIIVRSEEEVEKNKEFRGSIIRNALREGIPL